MAKKQEEKVEYSIQSMKLVKVKKNTGLDLAFEKIRTKADGRIVRTMCKELNPADVHPDVKEALKGFLPHFMIGAELKKESDYAPSYFRDKKFLTDSDNDKYQVTGFHIKQHKEHESIIIVGRKKLNTGRVISMVVPMISLDAESEDRYKFIDQISDVIELCSAEAGENLEGKVHPGNQLKAEFSEKDKDHNDDVKGALKAG
jgi:hypothetical protein